MSTQKATRIQYYPATSLRLLHLDWTPPYSAKFKLIGPACYCTPSATYANVPRNVRTATPELSPAIKNKQATSKLYQLILRS